MYSYAFDDGVWQITFSVDADGGLLVEKAHAEDKLQGFLAVVPAAQADRVLDFLNHARFVVRNNRITKK